jgi:hypothetical protein
MSFSKEAFDTFEQSLVATQKVLGWLTFDEAYFLARCAQVVPYNIVEIGSYHGLSTLFLAFGGWHGLGPTVYAVDPHRLGHATSDIWYNPADQQAFYHNVAASGYGSVIRAIGLPSTAASRAFEDRSVDMIFIDGEHTPPAVAADVMFWVPKLKPGGLLCMHDSFEPGPALAILGRPYIVCPIGRVDSTAVLLQGEALDGVSPVWPLDLLSQWTDFTPGHQGFGT